MPLIFENPAPKTQPLFDRLRAAAFGHIEPHTPIFIGGIDDVYAVIVRPRNRPEWYRVGSPDVLVAAFREWLNGS